MGTFFVTHVIMAMSFPRRFSLLRQQKYAEARAAWHEVHPRYASSGGNHHGEDFCKIYVCTCAYIYVIFKTIYT